MDEADGCAIAWPSSITVTSILTRHAARAHPSLGAGHVIEFGVDGSPEIDRAGPAGAARREVGHAVAGGVGRCSVGAAHETIPVLLQTLATHGECPSRNLRTHSPTLEDVFVTLTGREPAR